MIIPDSNLKIHLSRPVLHRAPVLKFEVAGNTELTRNIECIKANSFRGLRNKIFREEYTSLRLDSKGFFKSRQVKVLVKNKDLKKLIGRLEFQRLQTLGSSSDRFTHLKKCVGPLNPLDGRCKSPKGSSLSEWQTLSLEINCKLKDLFANLESADIKKVRRAVNKMILSKETSIFALVNIEIERKKEQIFLRKHKGKLFIDRPKACGEGGTATVYKVHRYALKKFTLADAIRNAEARYSGKEPFSEISQQLKKDVEEEIQACNDVKKIPGTLKIKAELKDMESDRLVGYVMKAYDGDFGDYLLSSLNSKNRPTQLCRHFKKLAHTFARMHKLDKVHRDIKIDNVFADFDHKGIRKLVIGDISQTDPDHTRFSYSVQYNFKSEVDTIKFDNNLTTKDRLSLQKKLDVRQFAFFMYYSIRAEQSKNKQLDGKVKLNDAFPPSDPTYHISPPSYYSSKEERIRNYTQIPKDKAPKALREFIADLLTEDFEKLPSMAEVHHKLKSIQSKAANS